MIGNDIVDLRFAREQSNWRRSGWLQKLFSDAEQHQILSSQNPHLQLWTFWSMKEAAYKVHQRRFSLLPKYNPMDFQCAIEGEVYVNNYAYKIISEITEQYVYSIARVVSDMQYSSEVCEIGTQVRDQLKEMIVNTLGIKTLISFSKDKNGIPVVYLDKKRTNIAISLTHHGRYSAFAVGL